MNLELAKNNVYGVNENCFMNAVVPRSKRAIDALRELMSVVSVQSRINVIIKEFYLLLRESIESTDIDANVLNLENVCSWHEYKDKYLRLTPQEVEPLSQKEWIRIFWELVVWNQNKHDPTITKIIQQLYQHKGENMNETIKRNEFADILIPQEQPSLLNDWKEQFAINPERLVTVLVKLSDRIKSLEEKVEVSHECCV